MPNAGPVADAYPAVLVQYLRACLWKRMLRDHDGIGGLMVWLFAGQKHPLTGERLPYASTPDALTPMLLDAAERWASKRAA